ncbi:carboxypeptidase-like regulatory domain-containing protein [Paludibacter jiangxiensis]|uniref:TonB-dependent outer membrane receptor, SusC/RagA subfamily n=1 Tax=Paludibacter jiangxiensis TaxID=681398 RepID=A0A161LEL7_9BACT|nr:carboxypeptidase-like regulatory domain-containing protein [Paludibacter jiangxiensis]GAT62757.1 TonB-dependent outer membrane receptor, SusC/RagA subfamily [Paludibacter jiangxiensis]
MQTHKILLLIFILSLSFGSFAQNSGKKYFITGQVLDANSKPVSGATVLVDNKSTNVVTDAKGNYKVKVKPDATVLSVFSIFNGLLINEEIKGRVVIDFKFEDTMSQKDAAQKANTENEEVNVGFGTVQKKDLPSNIATVDRKKNKYESYQNIYDLIRAELSNVQVVGEKIILKGAYDSNTGPYDAMILVDGVESSLSSVLPRMVKSISVLTGADASIYGLRSAHGVVLITLTKE